MSNRVLVLQNKALAQDSERVSLSHSHLSQMISFAIRKAYVGQINNVVWGQIGAALTHVGVTDALWEDAIMQKVRSEITKRVTGAIFASADTGYNQAMSYVPQFATPKQAESFLEPWSRQYAALLTEQTVVQSDEAVRESLARYIRDGLPPDTIGNRIRTIFGLDPRSAKAVDNYRDGLARAKTPGGVLARMVVQYADKSRAQRFDKIGRTEAMTSMNFGRQILFDQAVLRGALPVGAKKTWVTAIDERVCPTCRPMDGQTVPFKESFSLGGARLMVPPAHPNCRCLIVPSAYVRQGIITRTARQDNRGLSDARDLIAV